MKVKKKLPQQRIFDTYLGPLLCFFINIFKKKKKFPNKINKIAIFRLSAIGDSVLCLPMIKKLKEKTKAEIIIVCSNENKDIFKNHKFIDKIIIFENKLNPIKINSIIQKLKRENIKIGIDTSQSSNFSCFLTNKTCDFTIGFKNLKRNKTYDILIYLDPKKHMVLNYLKLISCFGIEQTKPRLIKPIYDESSLKNIKDRLGNKKNLVGIHPCNLFKYREWPRENFTEIIKYLVEKYDCDVVLVGSPNERRLVENLIKIVDLKIKNKIINLCGQINIKELTALMPHFKLFIANDGGPMHLAAAMQVPTLGLFGSDTPLRYAPFNDKSISLYKKISCSPCNKAYASKWPKCKDPKCLKAISVEEVKEAIKILEEKNER